MKKSKIAQIVNQEYYRQYLNDSIFHKTIDSLTLRDGDPTEDVIIKIISDICELYLDRSEECKEHFIRNEV